MNQYEQQLKGPSGPTRGDRKMYEQVKEVCWTRAKVGEHWHATANGHRLAVSSYALGNRSESGYAGYVDREEVGRWSERTQAMRETAAIGRQTPTRVGA